MYTLQLNQMEVKIKKNLFYKLLNKTCIKNEKHQKLIIAGDFNAKTSIAFQKCCFDGMKIIPDNDYNENGSRLKNFCRRNTLCIASTYFEYSDECRYTWYSCDKKTKRINDYVITERFVQQYVTDCLAKPEYDFDSDHRILITYLRTPTTRKARWRRKSNSKKAEPDEKFLEENETRKSFHHSLSKSLESDTEKLKSSTDFSNKIVQSLHKAASTTLPQKHIRKQEKEIWKNDKELNILLNQRLETEKKSTEYKLLTKKIKTRVNLLRNYKLRQEAEQINEYANRKKVEELYRNMKSDGSTFHNVRRKNQCDPVKLKEYFSKHFNRLTKEKDPIELSEAPTFITILQDIPYSSIKTCPPDRSELETTIKSLKNGKSTNDIPIIYLKTASENNAFMNELVALYKTIWETKKIPKNWGHTKLVAIWKGSAKGNIDDPKAYRALQVGSSLCKIMTITILNRVKVWYENQLMDQQQGFRSGRGTTDGIFIAKSTHQITDKMKKPVYVLFVDLTAAFDHIDRDWLFKMIKQRLPKNANNILFELIKELYTYTTTALADYQEAIFELTLGVRQGGPESPMLFNIYIDYVIRVFLNICKEKGVHFLELNYKIPSSASSNGRIITGKNIQDWTGYADDLCLMLNDKENLQLALEILNKTFRRFSLEINVTKTKTMILNHQYLNIEYPSSISELNGIKIENVTSFRYLGYQITFNEPGTGDAETELRIDCAECKFYQHGKKFMNRKIDIRTRVIIYNSLVRSRLTYSCQIWCLTKTQLNRVNAAYIMMLRKMVKGGFRRKQNSWSFVLANKDILKICGTENIYEYTSRLQRNYLAHIIRSEDTKITKQLLFNNNIATKRGRQVNIKNYVLKNQNCTEEQFNKNAMTRKF